MDSMTRIANRSRRAYRSQFVPDQADDTQPRAACVQSQGRPVTGPLDWPIAPFLIATAFIVSSFVHSAISPFGAFRSLGVALLLSLIVSGGACLAFRDRPRAALAASAVVVGIIARRPVVDGSTWIADLLGSMPPAIAVGWTVLVVTTIGLLARIASLRVGRLPPAHDLFRFVNVFASVLLAVVVLGAVAQGRIGLFLRDLDQGRRCVCPSDDADPDPALPPDVYLILLDGDARADVLDDLFGFDNGPFLAALEARGFEIAERSESNYFWTHSTLVSMLNLQLVEDVPRLEPVLRGEVATYPTVREAINENAVFARFREAGYEIVTTGSGFERESLRRSDIYLDSGEMNEFEYGLLLSTLLGDALRVAAPDFAAAQQRSRVLSEFEFLREASTAPRTVPRFVFVHVPSPHHPIVFNADGSPRPAPMTHPFFADSAHERGVPVADDRVAYAGQLAFLNTRVLDAVDELIDTRPNAYIIIMSDHGSATGVNWQAPTRDQLRERVANLWGARTPGSMHVFSEDQTPVNAFRRLFAALFRSA
jgi:hypothetical protein